MRRYIPKNPIISGVLTGISAAFMQFFCVLGIGFVSFVDYENLYLDKALVFLCISTNILSIKSLHDLCYGIIGRNIKHNQLFINICPYYEKLHNEQPILENIKLIYEYPLSAIGFIETLDDLYPPKNKM